MAIDDTIKTLTKIYQSIDQGIPTTAASPDALVNHLNDLYGEACESLTSEELFAYDDVRSPSITLTISTVRFSHLLCGEKPIEGCFN